MTIGSAWILNLIQIKNQLANRDLEIICDVTQASYFQMVDSFDQLYPQKRTNFFLLIKALCPSVARTPRRDEMNQNCPKV